MKNIEIGTYVCYNININYERGDEFMKELLKKAKEGDRASIEALLNKFEPLIKKSSRKYYINGYEQRDVKQLAYMAALKAIKKFDTERSNSFPLYVKRTIQNSIYKEVQKSKKNFYYRKVNEEIRETTEIKNIEDKSINIDEEIIRKERRDTLINLINKMTVKEKELITKVFIEEKTLREYAEEKKIKYHKVFYLKKKILQKIESFLED